MIGPAAANHVLRRRRLAGDAHAQYIPKVFIVIVPNRHSLGNYPEISSSNGRHKSLDSMFTFTFLLFQNSLFFVHLFRLIVYDFSARCQHQMGELKITAADSAP